MKLLHSGQGTAFSPAPSSPLGRCAPGRLQRGTGAGKSRSLSSGLTGGMRDRRRQARGVAEGLGGADEAVTGTSQSRGELDVGCLGRRAGSPLATRRRSSLRAVPSPRHPPGTAMGLSQD